MRVGITTRSIYERHLAPIFTVPLADTDVSWSSLSSGDLDVATVITKSSPIAPTEIRIRRRRDTVDRRDYYAQFSDKIN